MGLGAAAAFSSAAAVGAGAGVVADGLELPPLECPRSTKNHAPASTTIASRAIWNGREIWVITTYFGISRKRVERRRSRWTLRSQRGRAFAGVCASRSERAQAAQDCVHHRIRGDPLLLT